MKYALSLWGKKSFKLVTLSYDCINDLQPLLHTNSQSNAKLLSSFSMCACYLYVKKKKKKP